jgi:hypothetical protein
MCNHHLVKLVAYTPVSGLKKGRRRWFEEEKLKIVLESLQAPHQIAAMARYLMLYG